MGDYKVTEVAVSDLPGKARLTLHATNAAANSEDLFLYVPLAIVEKSAIVAGLTVTARARDYGVEFSKQESNTSTAFFLVLNDDAYRELHSVAVSL